jgi:hypothetical protein
MSKIDCCWNCNCVDWFVDYGVIQGSCFNERSPYYGKEVKPDCNCKLKFFKD